MKRKREQERDEAIAREQADARREALLAELRARESSIREPDAAPVDTPPEEPAPIEADAPEADAVEPVEEKS